MSIIAKGKQPLRLSGELAIVLVRPESRLPCEDDVIPERLV